MARIEIAAALAMGIAMTVPDARAATLPAPTTEQAASLGQALKLWTAGLVSGDAAAPGFTATPADGHYDIAIPIAGTIGDGPTATVIEGEPITAQATQSADGRWHFDAIKLPSPLRVTTPLKPGEEPLRIVQEFGEQTGSAVVDPTLASNSTGESTYGPLRQHTEGAKGALAIHREVTADRVSSHVEWIPASAGRVDAATVIRTDGLAIRSPGPAASHDGFTIGNETVTAQATDIDPERTGALLRKGILFLARLRASDARDLTPEQRAAAHELIDLAHDLAHETKLTTTAEKIAFMSHGRGGTLDRAMISEAVKAPDGKLDVRLRLELAGLTVPFLPPGAMQDLLPKHLVFAPFITGTPVDDVAALANQAIDGKPPTGAPSIADDIEARLAKAPVTVGIDELALDLGPASLSAKGKAVVGGRADVDASAVIEATGLDALIKVVGADPMLKQGVPVLILLKGIGDEQGDKTVWKIAYAGGKVTVNGTDMSALMGGK